MEQTMLHFFYMLHAMENFVLTIAYLLIGMGLRRMPKMPGETAQVLNLFVIYVSLPALILLKVPELVFSRQLLVPVLMPWLMLGFSAALVLALGKITGWERGLVGVLLLLVPLGNTSFLGIPMVEAFFGGDGIPYAVFYDQFGSFLALATYGSAILAIYGSGESFTVREVVMKIITFPPFIALVAALFLEPGAYPKAVATLLKTLADTLVPVVMIAVGYQLTLKLSASVLKPLTAGLVIKLAVAPLAALLVCRALGITALPAQVAIFEAGMPPMVTAGALAIVAGLSPELTAALVGLGIVASFVTLPLLFQLL